LQRNVVHQRAQIPIGCDPVQLKSNVERYRESIFHQRVVRGVHQRVVVRIEVRQNIGGDENVRHGARHF